MSPRSPIILVGLDACDAGVAQSFAAQGHLPSLSRLFGGAARARVRNPMGLFVGAVWMSFSTGLRADRHGVHCWDEIDVASYRRRTMPPLCEKQLLWQSLSDAGRRVAVLDVPHTRADQPVNGVQISEWGCHDRHFGFKSWPHNLAGEIDSSLGLHPIFGMDAYEAREFAADDYMLRADRLRTLEEDQALLAGLRRGIGQKADLSTEILGRETWDLFLTVFGESHAIGHQQWHLHDPSHPRFDPEAVKAVGGDPVLQVYQDLDAALGRVLESAGDDATILVLLSHGMGPHYDGTHLLDEILHRIDAFDHGPPGLRTAIRRAGRPLMERYATAYAVPALRWYAGKRDFPACREWVGTKQRAKQHFYVAPNNYCYGGVRFNVIGREPRGSVHPDDLDRSIAELSSDLMALVNLDTGGPVITGVDRSSRWYRRSPHDTLPDLFLDWERSGLIETVWSPKTGIVHAPYTHWRSGDHRPEGLLLALGPGIPARIELPPIEVEDFAPSIARRLGARMAETDGNTLPWLAVSD
jgi:predicted AlkP superfamily phosphohydrolase/phosphomutase